MKRKKILLLALLVFFAFTIIVVLDGTVFVNAAEKENTIQGNYVYPVTPEDEAWTDFENVEEKIAACRIPGET